MHKGLQVRVVLPTCYDLDVCVTLPTRASAMTTLAKATWSGIILSQLRLSPFVFQAACYSCIWESSNEHTEKAGSIRDAGQATAQHQTIAMKTMPKGSSHSTLLESN